MSTVQEKYPVISKPKIKQDKNKLHSSLSDLSARHNESMN